MKRVLTLDEVRALGGYKVIYADPGWSYDQKVRTKLDYTTNSPAGLAGLPVGQLASPTGCALFCWGTWPQLPVVLATIEAWGFEYKTLAFVWVKRNAKAGSLFWGAGSWTRANTEPCFLAVKGKPKRVDVGVHQLIEDLVPEEVLDSAVGAHSAKPAAARERVVRLLGDVPRIELFARERVRGWDAWGDDPALGGSDVSLEVSKRVIVSGPQARRSIFALLAGECFETHEEAFDALVAGPADLSNFSMASPCLDHVDRQPLQPIK